MARQEHPALIGAEAKLGSWLRFKRDLGGFLEAPGGRARWGRLMRKLGE